MAIGSNFVATVGRERKHRLLMQLLGLMTHGDIKAHSYSDVTVTTTPRRIAFIAKADTAPATNTANDAPTGKGDLCLVVSTTTGLALSLYRCTAYTNATTFTWTQIV